MSEQEQPQKNTKGQVIVSHAFFLFWGSGIVTIQCKAFGILPNHWVVYLAILIVVLTACFKLSQLIISKGSPIDDGCDTEDMSDRLTNDICNGIAPHGYWWDNNSTTTHTHDPYISTTTYTSYDRDR